MQIDHLIIDTDPGVDDAITLLIAMASPEIQDLMITAVHGNVSVDRTFANACGLVELARKNIPVYKGEAKPLLAGMNVDASDVHGADGLQGLSIPSSYKGEKEHAVDALIDKVLSAPGAVTILALGALTNIACALNKNPAIATRVRQLIVMGGAFDIDGFGISKNAQGAVGNMTPYAEFNMLMDPVAAQKVFEGFPDIVLCPLNLTRQVLVGKAFKSRIASRRDPFSQNIAGMLDEYTQGPGGARPLHDANTIVWLLRPELYGGIRQGSVSVDMTGETIGRTVFTSGGHNNVKVVSEADASAILDFVDTQMVKLAALLQH